ncbi:MAG: FAD-binding oxidoreductase [Proteobacteria bacterium]|jgi:glycine oxidase|nr:FAD-binding oxidoreductase [Pseudomonadota bacterium]
MADVTIYGGGILGLATAWSCIKKGARVRVIEKLGVGYGSSGSPVGALAPHTPDNWNEKKQFQFESLALGKSYWAEIERVSGLPTGYVKCGRLQAVQDQRTLLLAKARVEGAKKRWGEEGNWNLLRHGEVNDWKPRSSLDFLIYDTFSAIINPRFACISLAKAISNLGGEIIIGEAEPVGKVIYATGAIGLDATPEKSGSKLGTGVKGQAILVRYNASGLPQLFVDGIYIIPHLNGTVAIGSTSEKIFLNTSSTDSQLEELYHRAIDNVPLLKHAKILSRWAGVRARTSSRSPIMGRNPLNPSSYIANGGYKIGFSMAPKIGEVMADFILFDKDEIPKSFKSL